MCDQCLLSTPDTLRGDWIQAYQHKGNHQHHGCESEDWKSYSNATTVLTVGPGIHHICSQRFRCMPTLDENSNDGDAKSGCCCHTSAEQAHTASRSQTSLPIQIWQGLTENTDQEWHPHFCHLIRRMPHSCYSHCDADAIGIAIDDAKKAAAAET